MEDIDGHRLGFPLNVRGLLVTDVQKRVNDQLLPGGRRGQLGQDLPRLFRLLRLVRRDAMLLEGRPSILATLIRRTDLILMHPVQAMFGERGRINECCPPSLNPFLSIPIDAINNYVQLKRIWANFGSHFRIKSATSWD